MAWTVLISTVSLLFLATSTHATRATSPPDGPGNHSFTHTPPSLHGLTPQQINTATTKVGKVKQRYCFLFIQNGSIVHEKYYANNSNTTYETDSLAKTMIALLVGAVWTHRPWNLDQPMSELGVDMSMFNHWEHVVTTRHVLAQASGKGFLPPGTSMNYDSDQYIQTLSSLLGKILAPDNITVIDWAEKNFAEKLGIAGVFYNNDLYVGGGNVSIGGGQRMTCRQIARVGQLALNKGSWWNSDGSNAQKQDFVLVDPDFIRQMSNPNFPESVTTYGFMTWLNKRGAAPGFCCAPRWCADLYQSGNVIGGYGGTSLNGIIGDDISFGYGPDVGALYTPDAPVNTNVGPVVTAPEDAMVALGYLGRLLYMFPSSNAVVVTMGQTSGSTLVGGGCNYDEGYALTLLYQAFEPLLLDTNQTLANVALKKWHANGEKRNKNHAIERKKENKQVQQQEYKWKPTSTTTNRNRSSSTTVIGSCFCFCSPGEGYGQCFDVNEGDDVDVQSDEEANEQIDYCAPYQQLAPDYCPDVGVAQQCSSYQKGQLLPVPTCAGSNDPNTLNNTVCTVTNKCPDRTGKRAEPLDTEHCNCKPLNWEYCYYIPSNTTCGESVLSKSKPNFRIMKDFKGILSPKVGF